MALNIQQIKLKATTAYVKLHAGVTASQLAASAQYATLQATTAYAKLKATIASTVLTASTQYVLLQATALTGYFVDLFNLADTTTLTDSQAFAIGKQFEDLATAVDQISIGANKTQADDAVISDYVAIVVQFVRDFSDIVEVTDVATRDVSKVLADNAVIDETTTVAFEKFLADVVSATDVLVGINFEDTESDGVVVDALGVDDDPVVSVGKVLADSLTAADSGNLLMQDYCDITYFLEDFVGVSRTF